MAITIGNPSAFTEGMLGDVMKAATNVDTQAVKNEWENIANTSKSDAERIQRSGEMINQKIGKPLDKRLQDINKTLDDHKIKERPSIIARSRNSVLQFPCYVTESLPVAEVTIISKLFERVYASLVQTALAQNPVVDEEEVNDLIFLKQFHTNMKESTQFELYNEYYEPIDTVDEIMKESVHNSFQLTPTMSVEFNVVPPTNRDLLRENARLVNEPLTNLRYLREDSAHVDRKTETTSQSSLDTTKSTEVTKLSAKEIEEIGLNNAMLTGEEKRLYGKSNKELRSDAEAKYPHADPANLDLEVEKMQKIRDRAQRKVDDAVDDFKTDAKRPIQITDKDGNTITNPDKKNKNYSFDGNNFIMSKHKTVTSTKNSKSTRDSGAQPREGVPAPKMLRDPEIKKLNNMLPWTFETTFRVRDKKNGVNYDAHFIIGVKTVMHLIRIKDFEDELRDIVTGDVKGLQKVRYKTGEIKFMDYVFNFKGLKADAAKRVNYNKKWVTTLKRMADFNKVSGASFRKIHDTAKGFGVAPDTAIPNATMILSESDIVNLTNTTGIDLGEVSNAKRLAKSLFLIGIAIVDPSGGKMKVMFPDSDNDWDIQSLATIDAELAKTDNSRLMRELNRMVNK